LESEILQLRKAAEVEAVAERARILAAAGAESESIHLAAKQEIAAAERAAALGLKRFVARLAIERAEADLRMQVTPQADATLVRSFIAGLENRPQ
jgi:F0F1-type ATP synthase membrane subunit b/b'